MWGFALTLIPAWAALVLAVAVCVLVSSCFRRSILALLGSYLALFILLISPYLLLVMRELPELFIDNRNSRFIELYRTWDSLANAVVNPLFATVAPVLCPVYYFVSHDIAGQDGLKHHVFDRVGGLFGVLLYVAATLLTSLLIGALASWKLKRTQRA